MLSKSSDSVCWDIEEIHFAKTIRFWEKKIFEIVYLLKIHVWHNWSVIMISGFETFSSHTNFNIILFKKTSYRYSWISFFRADSVDLCPIILFYSFLGIFEAFSQRIDLLDIVGCLCIPSRFSISWDTRGFTTFLVEFFQNQNFLNLRILN